MAGAVFHGRAVRLLGKAGGEDQFLIRLLAGGALLRVSVGLMEILEPFSPRRDGEVVGHHRGSCVGRRR